jgi:hypothetical protein
MQETRRIETGTRMILTDGIFQKEFAEFQEGDSGTPLFLVGQKERRLSLPKQQAFTLR